MRATFEYATLCEANVVVVVFKRQDVIIIDINIKYYYNCFVVLEIFTNHLNFCSYSPPRSKQDQNGEIIKNHQIRPLSNAKSSDWTEVALEVPSEKEEVVHKQNPQLTQIFNHNGTPTPPPRKHKKGIREKIESVARSGLQAIQGKKPVEEPLCTKKIINYGCPLDDDGDHHNRDHKRQIEPQAKTDKVTKRRKNLSVVSLPNYNDLKFSIAKSEDADAKVNGSLRNSALALETRKTASSGKLENYMTRCRSFGSILPQQFLDKFKPRKAPADVESDDSFGPLEDWDLKIIEHYNPKDASLPRPPKPQKTEKEILSDVESLIVSNEEAVRPVPPVRKSESLLKKLNRKASESANIRKSNELLNNEHDVKTPTSITPPPSPEPKRVDKIVNVIPEVPRVTPDLITQKQEAEPIEHSSLLKILEDYSVKDKQNKCSIDEEPIPLIDEDVDEDRLVEDKISSNLSSLTPSLVEFEKTMTNTVEDFINTEKKCASKDLHFTKFGSLSLPQNAAPLKT